MGPLIAGTSGEPAGIGPELCLCLAEKSFPARVVVLADRGMVQARAAQLGSSVRLREWVATASPRSAGTMPAGAGVVEPESESTVPSRGRSLGARAARR